MTSRAKPPSLQTAAFVWCVLLMLSACVVALAFRTRACFVDDAFTGFQYLRNLLAGEGFVLHAGDPPVEGVTNVGWLLALAPWCVMADPLTVAKLAGLALVLLSLILTVFLGRSLAAGVARPEDYFALVLPPVLMLATSFELLYFSLAGMETGLLTAILLLMACVALRRPRSIWLPLLGAFAFLVHPEAVLVYPLYAALSWQRERPSPPAPLPKGEGSRRWTTAKLAVGNLILAVLVVGVTAFRYGYFHDPLPNTFHAKPGSLGLAVENGYALLRGQNVNVGFPITGWLALPMLLLGYRRLRRAAGSSSDAADMLGAICAVGLAFAVYSPPDWTALPRYFAPYLPAALLLLWAGVAEVLQLWLPEAAQLRTRQAAAAAVALLLALGGIADGRAKMAQMEQFPGYVLAGKNLIQPALWMRDHLPEEATIATRRIGALAYYSQRRPFDYAYGLPDPQVARLVARHGGRFDTPADPALAALWRQRAPDYLLEDAPIIDRIIAQAGGTRGGFSIHGLQYRVVAQFPIGDEAQWVLAQRIPE